MEYRNTMDEKMICSCGCGAMIKVAEECLECHDRPDRTGMCVNCVWRVRLERLYHLKVSNGGWRVRLTGGAMKEEYRRIGSHTMRVIEECSEILQIAMKGERFGWGNHHPDDTPDVTNLISLRRELDDLNTAVKELEQKNSSPEP